MKLTGLSKDKLLELCSWCHEFIPEDKDCFGFGVMLKDECQPLILGKEGTVVLLKTAAGREIISQVTTLNSAARRDGYEVCVQLCSEDCEAECRAVFRDEFELPIEDDPDGE